MNNLYFLEKHTDNVVMSIKIDKHVYSAKSPFQQIDIFDSVEFGRILTLDSILMLTERDEFIYHEMMSHVALAVNPEIKNILVIGAGDGGIIRELCKYDTISSIDLVEIDEMVVLAAKEFLPKTSSKLDDKRVTCFYEDGLKYIRRFQNKYDLIIVDSTDPFGPGEGLFTKEFYGNCYSALTEDGILLNQHESPFYEQDAKAARLTHKRIKSVFPICEVYQAHIPTYASGHWLFGFASKNFHPIQDLDLDWELLNIEANYYNTSLHQGAFCLPTYVEKLLEGEHEN